MSEVQQLYLDDLHVGQRFTSGSYLMEAARIKEFAAQFDPQPFHLDEAAAEASAFKGLAASGWHNRRRRHAARGCRRPAISLTALSAWAEKSPGPSPRGQAILCKSKVKLSKSRRRVRSRNKAS